MKYIFIDTNLFIDIITCNDSENILNSILKTIQKKNNRLILPEVIKMEILTQYNYWKKDVIGSVEANLETKKILGIHEALTDKGSRNKKHRGETEAEKIDDIIKPHTKEIIQKIKNCYELTSKKINEIFSHENTEILALTDEIILSGMKRSLLKRAPYTRLEKQTESVHTKDIDCMAFETLVTFFNRSPKEHKKDILIMCVSDQDYFSSEGELHSDLMEDLVTKNRNYQSIPEMLKKEFRASVKTNKKTRGAEMREGSLAGSTELLIESIENN